MIWLWTVLGMIVGATLADEVGLVAGGLAGYLLARMQQLSARVAELSDEVARWRASPAAPVAESVIEPMPDELDALNALDEPQACAARAESPRPSPAPPAMSDAVPASPDEAQWPSTAPAGAHGYGWQPPVDSAPQDTPFWQRAYDWLVTGNVVAKLGVIVLFFGLAFLLKYAADRAIFPIEWRLATVALGGGVLFGFGWFLRHRHAGYALVLQGGGVGVVYLTLFAAFRLYEVLPASLTLGLMLLVVALAAALAIVQDARSLAVLGISGGFLAPILVGDTEGSHVELFSYYLILNSGIVAIAWRKAWRGLNLLAFLFTFVIGTAWGVLSYQPTLFASTEPFLLGFFLIFLVTALLFARQQVAAHQRDYVQSSLVFGPPLVGFAWQSALVEPFAYGLAWSALGLGLGYLGLYGLLRRWDDGRYALLRAAFLALGIGFASLAVLFAFDVAWTAMTWAIEGAAMLWIGQRQGRRLPVVFGLGLQLAAGGLFLGEPPALDSSWVLLSPFFFSAGLLGLAGLMSAWVLQTSRLAVWLWVWGLLWWFGGGFYALAQSTVFLEPFTLWLMFAAASFGGLAVLRRWLDWSMLAQVPALWLGTMWAVGLLIFLLNSSMIRDLGWFAWLMGFAVLYGSLFAYERRGAAVTATARVYGLALWLMLLVWAPILAEWVYGLVGNFTLDLAWLKMAPNGGGSTATGAWLPLSWGLVGTLLLGWLHWARHWPLAAPWLPTYRGWVAGGFVIFLLGWLSLMNGLWLTNPNYATAWAAPWSLGYVPLLNGVDALSLGALGVLWQVLRVPRAGAPSGGWRLGRWWLVFAGFLWLNALIARSLSVWTGAPLEDWQFLEDARVQTAYSIAWSLLGLALMGWSSRRQFRPGWWLAAALLALVVLKLFLVDLSGSDTLARIISFVGAGVLLLVAGYVAPIPAKPAQPDSPG
ncbi:DUF2339 domain-containing protein [Halothiobacillus sp. DCM-1]|uniref:DUF2339 domain-containing protein n=1 Tax=Halothiobacillus sp. DCM-1 TaxID=3112558 RepID=UPI00325206DC